MLNQDLALQVPEQDSAFMNMPAANGEQLGQWLASLPLTNIAHTSAEITSTLHRLNRTAMDAHARLDAIAVFVTPVAELVDMHRANYRHAALPLSRKNQAHLDAAFRLLQEMGEACKLIIRDLQYAGTQAVASGSRQLLPALHRAMHYLSSRILESYIVYATCPPGAWRELNQLYHYAVREGIHKSISDDNASPEMLYKRIVLLALANPYKLMQGESLTVYEQTLQWFGVCHIREPEDENMQARFYVDLDSDHAPRSAGRGVPAGAVALRIIDLSELAAMLDDTLHGGTHANGHGSGQGSVSRTYAQRIERDMLIRLKQAWGTSHDRVFERTHCDKHITVAVGLCACHHFISGEAGFSPELDEVRMYRSASTETASSLSLVPLEHEPWKADRNEEILLTGMIKPRSSQFDSDSHELDIWSKIYATDGRQKLQQEASYETMVWQQIDDSKGGMALSHDKDARVKIKAGDLVTYRPRETEDGVWSLGSVRWLRMEGDKSCKLAVMRLVDSARAVAARAVSGIGMGTEYFRCLLTPNGDVGAPDSALIVPAAIYDIGSVLAINLGDRMVYARLLRLLETTRTFSQFEYEVIDIPEGEQEKVDALQSV